MSLFKVSLAFKCIVGGSVRGTDLLGANLQLAESAHITAFCKTICGSGKLAATGSSGTGG